MGRFSTEEGRREIAQESGRGVARAEFEAGHTTPRNWEKDGEPYAGAYSYLAATGFSRLGCRTYSIPFVDAYREEFRKLTGKA